eukprot:IDg2454t1
MESTFLMELEGLFDRRKESFDFQNVNFNGSSCALKDVRDSVALSRLICHNAFETSVTFVTTNEYAVIDIVTVFCSTSVKCKGHTSGRGIGHNKRADEINSMWSKSASRALFRAAMHAENQAKSNEEDLRNDFSNGRRAPAIAFTFLSAFVERI